MQRQAVNFRNGIFINCKRAAMRIVHAAAASSYGQCFPFRRAPITAFPITLKMYSLRTVRNFH